MNEIRQYYTSNSTGMLKSTQRYIRCNALHTTKYKEGHNFYKRILTFTFKVSSQGEVNYFADLVIPDVEKLEFDTEIKSLSCIQAKLKHGIKSKFDLDF